MGKHILQILAVEDNYVYLYDADAQTIRRLCDIEKASDLPSSVIETLKAAKLFVKGTKDC
jgi:hypothetical protein